MLSQIARAIGQEPYDPDVSVEIGTRNNQRINRLLWILVLVHFAHVVVFWPYTPGAIDKTHEWHNGVIIVHAVMIVVIAILIPIKMVMERKQPISGTYLATMSWLVSLLYLLLGVALTIIDQLVTSAITPLLIASIGAAVAISLRPTVAAFNYAIALVLWIWGVSWAHPSSDILLTVRVNGITATSLGFGLAVLQWRYQMQAIVQQRRIAEQQRALEETNRKLTLQATRDVLTELLNRAQFIVEVNREVARMQRTASPGCVVMLDVDHFKRINDTHGHPTGDRILVEMARLLTRMVRDIDQLARFGGEEFAILLPDTSLQEGVLVAERLQEAIQAHPFRVGEQSVTITASFGVAELLADNADAFDRCYHAADKALYQAKEAGRNCVRYAQPEDPLQLRLLLG